VKNWFQNLPFKCNLQRYIAALKVLDLHSNKLTTVPPELGGAVQVELI
jgi:hypothetical protein